MPRNYSLKFENDKWFLFHILIICVLIYSGSLFFPLMDKDAAHHANIALHMIQYNDYISLVDRHMEYLDKPHFLFWISALNFKIFGVNTFAYRLPAILFGLISIFSTYRLARHLSDKTTAALAAIMLATAQGFILSINDARMENPLMAAIIFGLWQLIVFIDKRRMINIILAALGAAIAFSTKGWIGPTIMLLSGFFYVLVNKKFSVLGNWKTWLFFPALALFIGPVLYAYYLQFDLHPEKVIRNMSNISGVKFILWNQNFERFGGDNFVKGGRNSSVFFLYHTFLWAFFPWCIAAYIAVFYWLRRMIYKKKWRHPFNFAALSFAFILFTISFSKFKMPHYVFMLLPLAALFTAPYLRLTLSYSKGLKFYRVLHVILAILTITAAIVLNVYFLPPERAWVLFFVIVLLIPTFARFIKSRNAAFKVIGIALSAVFIFNILMNYNFFPNLLRYQGGNELVKTINDQKLDIDDSNIYLMDVNAHSFDFYRGYNHQIVEPTDLRTKLPGLPNPYFLLSSRMARDLADSFRVEPVVSHVDYNVTTLKLKFLNPPTRLSKCDTLMLARITKL